MPTLEIQIYDGRRRPFLAGNVLVYVRKKFEGKNLVAKYVDSDRLDVNFDDNPGELVVIAARDGFHQCGVFVKDLSRPVSLMLVHKAENMPLHKFHVLNIILCLLDITTFNDFDDKVISYS